MKPSQCLDKYVLEFLSKKENVVNNSNLQSVNKYYSMWHIINPLLYKKLMKFPYNYTCNEITNALHRMDGTNYGNGCLNIFVSIEPRNGKPTFSPDRRNGFTGWLTAKGKDYLYDLNHMDDKSTPISQINNTNIGSINGTTNLNSSVTNQFNQNGQIDVETQIKSLNDSNLKDKKTLKKLVNELYKINRDKRLSTNRLFKFKSFIKNNWHSVGKIISKIFTAWLLNRFGLK